MKTLMLIMTLVFITSCAHHRGKRHWKEMDSDSDGRISKQEFDSAYQKKWTAMDADQDGFVTMEEKKQWHKNKKNKK